MVEVAEIYKDNLLRVQEDGATTQLLKTGLYGFDANNGDVRVFKGEALVQDGDQNIKVKGGHELDLNNTGNLKTHKFNKSAYEAERPVSLQQSAVAVPGRSQRRRRWPLHWRRSGLVRHRLVLGPVLHGLHLDSGRRDVLQPVRLGILLAVVCLLRSVLLWGLLPLWLRRTRKTLLRSCVPATTLAVRATLHPTRKTDSVDRPRHTASA